MGGRQTVRLLSYAHRTEVGWPCIERVSQLMGRAPFYRVFLISDRGLSMISISGTKDLDRAVMMLYILHDSDLASINRKESHFVFRACDFSAFCLPKHHASYETFLYSLCCSEDVFFSFLSASAEEFLSRLSEPTVSQQQSPDQ